MSASYPSSASSDTNLYLAKNNLATTLNGAINNSTTTVVLTDASSFPTSGFVTIDTEAISYTGKSTNTLTGVTRGADSTTAASHSNGAAVNQFIVAAHHNALKDEVVAVETDLINGLGTLNDGATLGSTATNIKTRLDQLATQVKSLSGGAS